DGGSSVGGSGSSNSASQQLPRISPRLALQRKAVRTGESRQGAPHGVRRAGASGAAFDARQASPASKRSAQQR
ncbi:hypothetical protein GGH99_009047, partial [Coemansia sp. RSA 1285]